MSKITEFVNKNEETGVEEVNFGKISQVVVASKGIKNRNLKLFIMNIKVYRNQNRILYFNSILNKKNSI